MKKKSFIVHDKKTGEEILIASTSFCYAVVSDDTTLVSTEDQEFEVAESIKVVQSLYEETEG
jgi:hypothetical protein